MNTDLQCTFINVNRRITRNIESANVYRNQSIIALETNAEYDKYDQIAAKGIAI